MPLYKIKDNSDIPVIDKTHLRVIWSRVIMHANVFHMENRASPRIYVGTESFNIINQSTSFSFSDINSKIPDYLGHFMGWNVFLSDELNKDEYVLGLDEREVKMCKRKVKLKQIITKLNATL